MRAWLEALDNVTQKTAILYNGKAIDLSKIDGKKKLISSHIPELYSVAIFDYNHVGVCVGAQKCDNDDYVVTIFNGNSSYSKQGCKNNGIKYTRLLSDMKKRGLLGFFTTKASLAMSNIILPPVENKILDEFKYSFTLKNLDTQVFAGEIILERVIGTEVIEVERKPVTIEGSKSQKILFKRTINRIGKGSLRLKYRRTLNKSGATFSNEARYCYTFSSTPFNVTDVKGVSTSFDEMIYSFSFSNECAPNSWGGPWCSNASENNKVTKNFVWRELIQINNKTTLSAQTTKSGFLTLKADIDRNGIYEKLVYTQGANNIGYPYGNITLFSVNPLNLNFGTLVTSTTIPFQIEFKSENKFHTVVFEAQVVGEDILPVACTQRISAKEDVNSLLSPAVYPNPNKGNFSVNFTSATTEDVVIKLIDVTGREVLTRTTVATIGENSIPLELNGSSSGVYLLQMRVGGNVTTTKVVVE